MPTTRCLVAAALLCAAVGCTQATPLPATLPPELILHRWYLEGVLPVQMTYEGYNFDILSGMGGLALALWAWQGAPPRWVAWVYNVMGLGLLITVASIAVMSSPLPLRQFHEGPPVLLAMYVPYVWIVPFCVAGALAGHIITFRHLRRAAAS